MNDQEVAPEEAPLPEVAPEGAPEVPASDEPMTPIEYVDMFGDESELSEGTRIELDTLEQEVIPAPEDMTAEQWEAELNTMREGEIEYLERQTQSEDTEISQRAEFVLAIKKDIDTLVDEVNKDVDSGDLETAEKKVKGFLKDKREYLQSLPLEGEDVEAALAQMDFLIQLDLSMVHATEKTRSTLLGLISLGIDIIPFVGGAKMMAEATVGKTLAGEDIEGWKRLLHMGEGILWEVVDVAALVAATGSFGTGGVAVETGAVGVKVARGAKGVGTAAKAAKAAEGAAKTARSSEQLLRGGALFAKNGLPGAKSMVRAGRFLEASPKIAKAVDTGYDVQKVARKGWEVKKVLDKGMEAKADYTEQMKLLDQINTQREFLTQLLDEMAINFLEVETPAIAA